MKNFLSKIIQFNHLNVVGIMRYDDKEVFHTITVVKNNSKINLTASNSYDSFEELNANFDHKKPIILVIDGKGILTKKIDLTNTSDADWIKNLDVNNIHFNKYTDSNSIEFISFCRKSIIQELVERFKKNNFQSIDSCIGNLSSIILAPTIKANSIRSNNSIVTLKDNVVIEISKSEEEKPINYTLDNLVLSNFHLPLYGAAINFYNNNKNKVTSTNEEISTEEFLYKLAFEKGAKIMLFSFFIALLASYTAIQYFSAKNAELNIQNIYSNQTFEWRNKLEKQKENKLNIINQTGIASSKYSAFYTYEIAKSVPSEINLNFLDIFPIEKEIKASEKVQLGLKIITIKGFTLNEPILNSWIEALKNFKWCNKLEIIAIKKDKNNTTFFELQINI